MNRTQLLNLADKVDNLAELQDALAGIANHKRTHRGTWAYFARKTLEWIEAGMNENCPYSVFMRNGNSKLPFFAFSSLPIVDCPGKGNCANWCYSLKAWRYPAAFFRQLQNSLLIRHKPEAIAHAWEQIPFGKTVRLFVDGDFRDIASLKFFMDLCHGRKDLTVYGYSKSWQEFVSLDGQGYAWPKNYTVNQSNGSRYGLKTGIARAFARLPIVRGAFVAVPVAREHIKSGAYRDKANQGSLAYRQAVKAQLPARGFACPGSCGNCLPGGRHACGSKQFQGISIGIGIHA